MAQSDMTQALDAPAIAGNGQSGQHYINPASAQRALKIFDALALFASFLLVFQASLSYLPLNAAIVVAGVIAAEVTYVCMVALRWISIYDIDFLTNPVRGITAAIGITTVVGCGILLIADATILSVPRANSFLWLIIISCCFAVSRLLAGLWARPLAASGAFHQRIAIVGGGDHAEEVIATLESSRDIDVEIVGMFDNRDDVRSPPVIRGYRKLGRISELEKFIQKNRVDLVIITIPMTAHSRLLQLLPNLWKLPVDVRICGQAIDMKLSPRAYTFLGKLPLLTVFSRPLGDGGLAAKRAVDILISGALLAVFSPLIALVAIAIALRSKGPVLSHVSRIGFDGKPIRLYRFRTHSAVGADDADPELTAVGRLLKLTAFDELPELFNVLKGDLSIVGPSVHVAHATDDVGEYEKVADSYAMRHGLKPGLLGWAQIHGFDGLPGCPEKTENRVKYDLEYIDRSSFLFDLRIMAKAPFAMLRSKNPQYVV